jgi:hypothetical protein
MTGREIPVFDIYDDRRVVIPTPLSGSYIPERSCCHDCYEMDKPMGEGKVSFGGSTR